MSTSRSDAIKLDCLDLEPGESKDIFCPFCGAQHEHKLCVTRLPDGPLAYFCRRASCGAKGFVGGKVSFRELRDAKKEKSYKKYTKETQNLKPWERDLLVERYEDDFSAWYPMRELATGRIVLRLLSKNGSPWGVWRKNEWNVDKGPKVLIHQERSAPRLHYTSLDPLKTMCVLVEDPLSAYKLSTIVPAVALLGTHLGDDEAIDLSTRYKHIGVALDPDATAKSLKIVEKLAPLVTFVTVVVLDDDPKRVPYSVLKEVFQGAQRDP